MDGRVAQLDCTLHVSGAPVVAQSLATRLKEAVRDNVIATYAAALDGLLGDDPRVYVLREVDCPIKLVAGADTTDGDLASRWGEGLAGGVARAIERADANCVAFADQADYVASFVTDLLHGVAWDRWFYGSFRSLRDRRVPEALRLVLGENRELLPDIAGALDRRHTLGDVLQAIGPSGSSDLWAKGFLPRVIGDGEGELFFVSALGLVDDLGLWKDLRPGQDVLRAYLSGRPPAADWRDQRSLANGLLDVLRFLGSQGLLRPAVGGDSSLLSDRLGRSLAKLDWLDAEWLQERLIDEVLPLVDQAGGLPARPPGIGIRSRQDALLEDLQAVLREHGDLLDWSQPVAVNAIRLHAWLSGRDPAWRHDPVVAPMIERVLRAQKSDTPFGDLGARVGRRDPSGRLQGQVVMEPRRTTAIAMPTAGRPSAPERPTEDAVREWERQAVSSGCAGVWLLARAVLDARLPGVLATTTYPSSTLSPTERLQTVLLAIALRWSGTAAVANGTIDPGLQMLAGGRPAAPETPRTIAQLRDRWAPDDDSSGLGESDELQLTLLRLLLGQRLIGGTVLDLHLVPLGDGAQALIAGDQSAAVWPLGCVIRSPRDAADATGRWSSAWSEVTGSSPVLVGDRSLTDLVRRAGMESIAKARRSSEEGARYRASRERLRAAIGALAENKIGRPSDDLAIGLMAITLVRVWARWLRQFGDSSVPYLLENLIRRAGWITVGPASTVIELAPRPLDIVVQMSGYAAEIEGVPWLGGRHIQFSMSA